jgi:alanyl-tRNA synthetase
MLVRKLTQLDDVVVLAGCVGETGSFFFGRSSPLDFDLRPLMENACRMIDGKGGGSPSMVQGKCQDPSHIRPLIDEMEQLVVNKYS